MDLPPLPLSSAQQRLWFLHRMEGPSATYNLPLAVRLEGDLDVPALEAAVRDVMVRHEILRTIFPDRDGVPFQQVLDAAAVRPVLSVEEIADDDLPLRLADAAARPFDIACEIPIRASLLKLGTSRHVLVVVLHHIAADGWSMQPLARDVAAAYAARRLGERPRWDELEIQYVDYALWQGDLLGSEDDSESLVTRQLEFWRTALAGAPEELRLPYDFPRPALPTYRGSSEPVWLEPGLHAALVDLAHAHKATLFMVLQAGLASLLCRLGAGTDIPIGTVVAGRPEQPLEDLIGCFVNALVLRTDVSGDPGFIEIVRRVRQFDLEAFSHQDLPIERLVESLGPTRIQSRQPLFQVVLTLQNTPPAELPMPGVSAIAEPIPTSVAKFDLTLSLSERRGSRGQPMGIEGRIEYSVDLFEPATARALASRFVRLLKAAVASPDVPLHQLPILESAERVEVLATFNATSRDVPAATLPGLIEKQVARAPESPAVLFEDEVMTYRQLNGAANRLARLLVAHGIGPESIAGIALDRSIDLTVAVLAVWKAGGGYLPLDPDYPPARIDLMIADARPSIILTRDARRTRVGGVPAIDLSALDIVESLAAASDHDLTDRDRNIPLRPEHPAYVIYTSGSTGTPKGVVVTHAGLPSLAGAQVDALRLSPAARVLQFASLNFDASLWEFVMAWTTGAALVLIKSEARSGAALRDALIRRRVTHALLLPAVLATLDEPQALPLETLIVGGEACPGDLVDRWSRGRRMVNAYGPTESTVCASISDLLSGAEAPPIGFPVWNTRAYVLDELLEPLPVGATGELYVAGRGLARGYLGRRALTAERFVANPFALTQGERMYRTGDLARWRHDGTLEYVGRADRQVKIRGFRIEPEEVEAVLGQQPGVALAGVVVAGERPDRKRLTAYVEPIAGATLIGDDIRRQLSARLPDYMVPSSIVVVERLPLLPSGKVARAALIDVKPAARVYRAPRGPMEQRLCEIFAEILQAGPIGTDDSFFELGGHSLMAMRIVSRIGSALGVEVPVRTLFEAPTISELALRLGQAPRTRAPLEPRPRPAHVPLSFAQQRLWFLYRLEGPSATYNIPIALRLEGDLDPAALEAALGDVVSRHESLRTIFDEADGIPCQRVLDPGAARVDVRAASIAEGYLESRLVEAACTCLQLSDEIPLRVWLFQLEPDRHVLVLVLHHIAGDGWSLALIARDLTQAYAARRAGRPPDWAPLAVQYADVALWQRDILGDIEDEDSTVSRQLRHWRDALAGAPEELALPFDHARPDLPSYRGGALPISIDAALHQRVVELARAEGASVFLVLQTTLVALLTKLGAGTDVVTGTVTAGRAERQAEDIVGFFVNTLPLRTNVSGNPSFRDLLARVRGFALDAFGNQDVPFERLVEALQPARSLSRHPIFQVMLTLQNVPRAELELPGVAVLPEPVPVTTARFDLTFDLVERSAPVGEPAGIVGTLAYAQDLFEAATASSIATRFVRLLAAAVATPDLPVHRLSILDLDERSMVLDRFNDTAQPTVRLTFSDMLRQHAARSPGRIAIVSGNRSLTYRELNDRAHRLARRLIVRGVGPESIVGVVGERSIETLVGVFGILRAGAAYLPLDKDSPPARLERILNDAVPALVLQSGDIAELDDSSGFDRVTSSGPVPESAGLQHAAYVIYTSGTTGDPKGVVVSHAGLVDLGLALGQSAIASDSRMLQFSSLTFDASVGEIAIALVAGCTLVLLQDDQRSGKPLRDALRAYEVTHAILPPVVLPTLEEYGDLPLESLIVAGETCPRELVSRWSPGRRMVNAYGPTETTVCATASVPLSGSGTPPIGAPIRNVQVFVLDAWLEPVPVGCIGELYVSGAALARGYLNRPAFTAERFVANPHSESPGARMYRTGDLARWRADGVLEYVGRVDDQVKIRGFRIELGEIESALLSFPDVSQAHVTVRGDPPGARQIVAYVVPTSGTTSDPDGLVRRLESRLPNYMLPSSIVPLAALPVTASGKVDRHALPAPVRSVGARAARSAEEALLCALLVEILGIGSVGIDDNFFALGGDSISSILLVSRARRHGLEISPRDVFRYPTIEALAAAGRPLGQREPAPIEDRYGEFEPTPIMRWLLDRGGPIDRFCQSTVVSVPPELTTERLASILQVVLDTHDVLRLELTPEARLRVRPPGAVTAVECVTDVDLSKVDPDERLERMRHELSAAADRLSPRNGRIFEAVWFRDGEAPTLGLVIHHLAVDSVSWEIVLSDLAIAWDSVARGEPPVLEQPATPFRVWAMRLAERSHSPAVFTQFATWEATVATAGALVPEAALSSSDTVATARELSIQVPPDITRAILETAAPAFHAQVDEILLTALGVAAETWRRRHGRQDETPILVDVERHGREPFDPGIDIDRVVGWFTSLSPIALGMPGLELEDALAGGPAMGRVLKHTRQALRTIPDRGIGYGLLRYSNPDTAERLAALPAAQIAFNFGGRVEQSRGSFWSPHPLAGSLQLSPDPAMPLAHGITINTVVIDGPEGPQIAARWIWASARLDESSVRGLADEWLRAVDAIGRHARRPGAGGRTPSDFPLVNLTQQQVDVLEAACGDVEDVLPLAPLQEGLLFHSLFDSAAPDVYVVQIALELAGLIRPAALEAAADRLLHRHGNLRVSIHHRGLTRPVQVVPHRIQVPWREIDLRNELDPRGRCDQIMRADREERFDPDAGLLMRFTLCRVADDRYVFAIAYHHVLFDGWSTPLLVAELLTLYHQNGASDRLPPVRPYTDFLRWLSEQDHERALNTWRTYLEGIDGPTLVAEPARAGAAPTPPARVEADVSEACTASLLALARQHAVTLNTVVQAGWAVLLGRLTARRDVTFGSTVSGRPPELTGVERMIGLFVNTVPVRVGLSPGQTFWDVAVDLQAAQNDLEDVQHVGLGDIRRLTGLDDLFDTLLVFENYPLDRRALNDASAALTIVAAEGHDAAHYPLTVVVAPGERLHLRVDYDASRLAGERVGKIAAALLQFLESLVATPHAPLHRLRTLDADERSAVLHGFNLTERAVSKLMLPQLFEEQVGRTPSGTAVVCGSESITYAGLNARANQVARWLMARHVGTESIVGIAMRRSIDMVAAVLGAMKAGAAYLALDPDYPAALIADMIEDATPALVLHDLDGASLDRLPAHNPSDDERDFPLLPGHPAYVIYTSGSTGTPKGVVVTHAGIPSLAAAHAENLRLTPASRVLQFSSLNFDASLWEMVMAFTSGATLVLIESDARTGQRLRDALVANQVTHSLLPPVVLGTLDEFDDIPLTTLIVGGEACSGPLVERWSPGRRMVNAYGPTESTVCATVSDPLHGPETPSIGGPVANTYICVLDAALEPVAVGQEGELYIGGVGLARGYLRRPGLTADRFVADPHASVPGTRMYRTGDLARWRHDGTLDYVGRADTQVKVRGYRVELGEIEAVLRADATVGQAVVMARDDLPGGRALVAYLVPASGEQIDAAALRARLAERLPQHMVPSAFVTLSTLPLTPNGKLDRQALPTPEHRVTEYRAPRTPQEQVLCDLFAEVLGVERVGIDDDFFALGGHSLIATRLASRIRAALGVELPLRTLFELPRIEALASRLPGAAVQRPPLRPQERRGSIPLSYAQQRLWFIDRLEGGSPEYNIPSALRLRGPLDLDAVTRSIQAIVSRHESLRTHFSEVEGEPVQVIAPSLMISVPLTDLRSLPVEEQTAAVRAAVRAEWDEPFDLGRGPVIRARLLRVGDDDHVLLTTFHHIVSDGWSAGVFQREFVSLYEAFAAGCPLPLAPLPVQYADFALWQRRWFDEAGVRESLAYWMNVLSPLPEPLALPTDRPRPAEPVYAAEMHSVTIPAARLAAVRALGSESGTTLYMILLATFGLLVQRYTGQTDIIVGSPIANRQDTHLESLIGFFVNTLVMRVRVNPSDTFRSLLTHVRTTTLDAYAHQDLPFERLVEELAPERRLNQTPVCQVVLALQNAPTGPRAISTLVVEPVVADGIQVRFDLEVHAVDRDGGVELYWVYKRELFDRWRIEQLARHFVSLLQAVVAVPDGRLNAIQLLEPVERRRLIEALNPAPRLLADEPLAALFEAQVEVRRDKTALIFGDELLTYGQLNARANSLAHELIARGVHPDDRVGVCLDRGLDMFVAVLAIVKAGAAYVPIAADLPSRRRDALARDARLCAVITTDARRASFGDVVDLILWPTASGSAGANPGLALPPTVAAYVNYTSGSTGEPKGVLVPQAAIVRLVRDTNYVTLDASTRTLQFAPLSFDAATFEIWAPLLNGGSIVIAPPYPHPLSAEEIGALVERHEVNTLWLTAGLFNEVVEHALQSLAPVRQLLAGGDVLSPASVDRVRRRHSLCQVINGYGPTENTTFSCCYRVTAAADLSGGVPIGIPISHSRAYVLDERLAPVPIGVSGELYVGGAGLARGYLHRPGPTAERFIADPFAATPGARMYRTGDRVRWRPDGVLEFVGRIDAQVKIRGYRVEPGEIEFLLRTHPRVEEALVLVEERAGDKQLWAYVVPKLDEAQQGSVQRAHVMEWRELYDGTYTQSTAVANDFNLTGWASSYTGNPIAPAEMRLWVEETVARIRALQPTRVLEVGCGTGLLLTRLAPDCAEYTGIDFSAPVLAQLRDYIDTRPDLSHVRLREGLAHELGFVPAASVDVVVLNSIVQYFPDVDYLAAVLREATRITCPGGHIFVGDVRSLPLLDAFHASVAVHRAGTDVSIRELRRQIAQARRQEKEIAIDPALFHELADEWGAWGRVDVLPKAGGYENEVSRFRYDVVLRLGPAEQVAEPPEWLAWDAAGAWEQEATAALESCSSVGIRRLCDGRVASSVRAVELLEQEAVPDLFTLKTEMALAGGVDPAEVFAWAARLGRALTWRGFTRDGRYDVIVAPEWIPRSRVPARADAKDLRRFANAPARTMRAAELGEELQTYVRQWLPDYMVPSAVTALDGWPLTANGKIDRSALPRPDRLTAETRPPRSSLEAQLCGLFAEVLGMPDVGIDDNFFAVGGHSLMATRLVSRIRARLGHDVAIRTLFEAPTVAALADRLATGISVSNALDRVLPLRREGSLPPLFCLPPGGGLSWGYAGLLGTLSPGRPVYGLQASGIASAEQPPATIDAVALDYLRLIQEMQPGGSYHLLGWSFGGLVAHTIACLLRERGHEIGLLAVLDSYPLVDVTELPALDDAEALKDLAEVVGLDFDDWTGPLPDLEAIVQRARATGHALGTITAEQARRMLEIGRHCALLAPGYEPKRLDADMLLFVAAEEPSPFARPDAWTPYVSGQIERHEIAARHSRMTDPEPLSVIGRRIESYLLSHGSMTTQPGRTR